MKSRDLPLVTRSATVSATVAGAFIAVILALWTGSTVALVGAAIVLTALGGLVAWIAPAGERAALVRILALAFAVRCAAAAIFFATQTAAGQSGFLTGDDILYSNVADAYAQWLHGTPVPGMGPPEWGGGAYVLGTYTYLTAGIYYLVGHQLLLVTFLNAAAGVAAIAFTWDIARRILGLRPARLAAAVLALYPTAIVFASINIKDALALLFASLTLWCIVRFAEKPAWRWIVFAGAGIDLTQGVRTNTALILVAALFATCLAFWARGATNRSWLLAGVVFATGLFGVVAETTSIPFSPSVLAQFELVRAGMSGGRTGFAVTVPTRSAQSASTFGAPVGIGGALVPQPTVSGVAPRSTTVPAVTLEETPLPGLLNNLVKLVAILVGAWLVWWVARRSPRTGTALLVSGFVGASVFVPWAVATFVSSPTAVASFVRTSQYLPYGLAHVLVAPFPWEVRSMIDAAIVPEMLVFYVLLAAALWTVSRRATFSGPVLPIVAYIAMTLGVFVLTEGNVGTLLRHRTMTVGPMVAVLAAPSLIAAWDAVARRRSRKQLGIADPRALRLASSAVD